MQPAFKACSKANISRHDTTIAAIIPSNLGGDCRRLPSYICASRIESNMLGQYENLGFKMLRLTNLDDPRRRCFCAVLILFAVFTLTVRVATRYCFAFASSSAATTSQEQFSPGPAHQGITQRLTKTTPTWLTPVANVVTLQAPTSYPRVAPAGPSLPGLVLEESLYNRPPPAC